MGDDSVMACIKNPKTSLVNVSMYWNSASWSTPLSDAHYGLSEMSGSLEDDFYTCTFHRDAVLNIPIPSFRDSSSNNKSYFDLDHEEYYLLLALGPVDPASVTLREHRTTSVSSNKVNLTEFSKVGEQSSYLIK